MTKRDLPKAPHALATALSEVATQVNTASSSIASGLAASGLTSVDLGPFQYCVTLPTQSRDCHSSPFSAPFVIGIFAQLSGVASICFLIVGRYPLSTGPSALECIAVFTILTGFACFLALTIGAFSLSDVSQMDIPFVTVEGHIAKWSFLTASALGLVSFCVLWHFRSSVKESVADESRNEDVKGREPPEPTPHYI